MKAKIILISIAVVLAITSAGFWLFISEKHAARDTRAKFFGTSQNYPTSGGEKMKSEW